MATRARLRCALDLAYGTDPSERLDVFTPRATDAPVLVYLQGGYSRALDKRDQSFVAAPFVEAGALVVLPNYALCPAVDIEHIVEQLGRALAWVWRHAAEGRHHMNVLHELADPAARTHRLALQLLRL